MDTKQRQIKARETWIRCYEQLGSISKAARKCGIPRSTLYRWIKRFKDNGKDALKGHSTRPKVLAKQKVSDELVTLIKAIRVEYNFGPQRISLHLLRVHNMDISAPTVWRVIKESGMPNIKKYRKHGQTTRYSRPIPGDRVQMDVTKIGAKCYQFTAIDDCTRMRAIKLYPIKSRIHCRLSGLCA